MAAAEDCLQRARIHLARGDAARSRAEVDAGLELARGSGSPVEAGLLIVHAQLEAWRFDPDCSLAAARHAARVARRAGAFVAAAELALGQALYVAQSDRCLKQFRKARRAGAASGDSDVEFEAWASEAGSLQIFGRSQEAIHMSEELHREAELRGKHIWAAVSAWMITRLGWLVFGHARAAIPELRRLHRSRVLGLHTPQVLGDLALALADLGDLEGARETINTAIAAADTTWTVGMTAYYHSEIAWASGRPERCLREVEDALKAELPVPIELVTRHVRLWALFELGRPEWDPHLPGAVPPLLKGVAADNEAFRLLCDGSVSEAEQAFRRAATAWAGNIFRSQVRSNWGAAMLQLRLGDKGGAHETLRQLESQATAAELASMVARIRQAARELEPTRQRPSARATLTPREREVLSCVAHGMSSKQVAAALHLSRATVESHVRVAMRKLSAATRLQAAAIAGLLPAIDSLDLSGPEQALLAMLVGGATLADAAVALGTSRRTATRRFARARAALRAR